MARFVLIHGAFGGSWCWGPVIGDLKAAGHSVEAIDLPGAGSDPTPLADVTLDLYAQRICEQLAEGPPALLVGQSMGGMAITQAAARCPERVAALAYVSAFVPQDGQSLLDLTGFPEAAGDQVQANIVVEGEPPVARMPAEAAPQALYHCAPPERAAWAAAQLGPQPVAAFAQPVSLSGAGERVAALPRAYVSCLQDRAIPLAMQRRMYLAAGCAPVVELDTDHSPWLSRPSELVSALDKLSSDLRV
jgi:pimeloyl-ACP methyl ester carboxylesterase